MTEGTHPPRAAPAWVAFAAQAAIVAAGLAVLALASAVKIGAAQPLVMIAAFGALYLLAARLVRRHACSPTRRLRWGPAAAALVGGALIKFLPALATAPGRLASADWARGAEALAPAAAGLTMSAVLWEELWFRAPTLELAPPRLHLPLALWNGLLFAALHVLNPKIDILSAGPELLAAGALLTLLCLTTGSVLVPLALHLGNNLSGAVLARAATPSPSAVPYDEGPETLVRAVLVAAIATVVVFRARRGVSAP